MRRWWEFSRKEDPKQSDMAKDSSRRRNLERHTDVSTSESSSSVDIAWNQYLENAPARKQEKLQRLKNTMQTLEDELSEIDMPEDMRNIYTNLHTLKSEAMENVENNSLSDEFKNSTRQDFDTYVTKLANYQCIYTYSERVPKGWDEKLNKVFGYKDALQSYLSENDMGPRSLRSNWQ